MVVITGKSVTVTVLLLVIAIGHCDGHNSMSMYSNGFMGVYCSWTIPDGSADLICTGSTQVPSSVPMHGSMNLQDGLSCSWLIFPIDQLPEKDDTKCSWHVVSGGKVSNERAPNLFPGFSEYQGGQNGSVVVMTTARPVMNTTTTRATTPSQKTNRPVTDRNTERTTQTPRTTTQTPRTTPQTPRTTTQTPRTTTTTVRTTTSVVLTQTPSTSGGYLFECDFETADLCGIVQSTNDNFDWTRQTGPTPSDPTGPAGAYSGSYYVFVEASDKPFNSSAILELPAVDRPGDFCLSFYYSMNGFHIKDLTVGTVQNGRFQQIWKQIGDQGPSWTNALINTSLQQNAKVTFTATVDGDYTGDIAIDNLRLRSGTC